MVGPVLLEVRSKELRNAIWADWAVVQSWSGIRDTETLSGAAQLAEKLGIWHSGTCLVAKYPQFRVARKQDSLGEACHTERRIAEVELTLAEWLRQANHRTLTRQDVFSIRKQVSHSMGSTDIHHHTSRADGVYLFC